MQYRVLERGTQFGSTLAEVAEAVGHILPQILETKRQYDEDEAFSNNIRTEYKGMLDSLRGNQDLANKFMQAGTINDPSELDRFINEIYTDLDAIEDKDQVGDIASKNMQRLSMLGGELMSKDWLAKAALSFGDQYAEQAWREQLISDNAREGQAIASETLKKFMSPKEDGSDWTEMEVMQAIDGLGENGKYVRNQANTLLDDINSRTKASAKLASDEQFRKEITKLVPLFDTEGPYSTIRNPSQAYAKAIEDGFSDEAAKVAKTLVMDNNALLEAERLANSREAKADTAIIEQINAIATDKQEALLMVDKMVDVYDNKIQKLMSQSVDKTDTKSKVVNDALIKLFKDEIKKLETKVKPGITESKEALESPRAFLGAAQQGAGESPEERLYILAEVAKTEPSFWKIGGADPLNKAKSVAEQIGFTVSGKGDNMSFTDKETGRVYTVQDIDRILGGQQQEEEKQEEERTPLLNTSVDDRSSDLLNMMDFSGMNR